MLQEKKSPTSLGIKPFWPIVVKDESLRIEDISQKNRAGLRILAADCVLLSDS